MGDFDTTGMTPAQIRAERRKRKILSAGEKRIAQVYGSIGKPEESAAHESCTQKEKREVNETPSLNDSSASSAQPPPVARESSAGSVKFTDFLEGVELPKREKISVGNDEETEAKNHSSGQDHGEEDQPLNGTDAEGLRLRKQSSENSADNCVPQKSPERRADTSPPKQRRLTSWICHSNLRALLIILHVSFVTFSLHLPSMGVSAEDIAMAICRVVQAHLVTCLAVVYMSRGSSSISQLVQSMLLAAFVDGVVPAAAYGLLYGWSRDSAPQQQPGVL